MRILVVEDDREVADYVTRALEEEGNSVTAPVLTDEPDFGQPSLRPSTSSCST